MTALSDRDVRAGFGPEYQALLFAWLVRGVLTRRGKESETSSRRAVWRFGVATGRPHGPAARARGMPGLSQLTGLFEWRSRPGTFDMVVLESAPDLHEQVYRCPWHQAWADAGLMDYGRFYCLDIDRAVAYGFNPRLILEVNGTHTNGAAHCDFVFRGAGLTPARQAELDALRGELGDQATMGWDYHTGHLFKAVGDVIVEAYGAEGQEMVAAALAAFADHFGAAAAQVVAGYADADFEHVPAG